jgi:hypothetical protein
VNIWARHLSPKGAKKRSCPNFLDLLLHNAEELRQTKKYLSSSGYLRPFSLQISAPDL